MLSHELANSDHLDAFILSQRCSCSFNFRWGNFLAGEDFSTIPQNMAKLSQTAWAEWNRSLGLFVRSFGPSQQPVVAWWHGRSDFHVWTQHAHRPCPSHGGTPASSRQHLGGRLPDFKTNFGPCILDSKRLNRVNKEVEHVRACRVTKSYSLVEWSIAYSCCSFVSRDVTWPFWCFCLGPWWNCCAGCQHYWSRDESGWTCHGWSSWNQSSSRTFVWPDSHQSMEHVWHLTHRVSRWLRFWNWVAKHGRIIKNHIESCGHGLRHAVLNR